jgi:hypothetical protein
MYPKQKPIFPRLFIMLDTDIKYIYLLCIITIFAPISLNLRKIVLYCQKHIIYTTIKDIIKSRVFRRIYSFPRALLHIYIYTYKKYTSPAPKSTYYIP